MHTREGIIHPIFIQPINYKYSCYLQEEYQTIDVRLSRNQE